MYGTRTITVTPISQSVADAVLTPTGHHAAPTNQAILTSATGVLPGGTVKATNILTLAGVVVNLDTVTIGSQVYTFETSLTDSPNFVLIGISAETALDNLIAAITNDTGEGTLYGTGTVVNADVTAVAGTGDTMDVEALVAGSEQNLVDTLQTLDDGTWATDTLEGGVGLDANMVFFLDPGEWGERNRGPYVLVSEDTNLEQWTIRKWEGGDFEPEVAGLATITVSPGFFDASNQDRFRLELLAEAGGTAVTVDWEGSQDGELWTPLVGVAQQTGVDSDLYEGSVRYINAVIAAVETDVTIGFASQRSV